MLKAALAAVILAQALPAFSPPAERPDRDYVFCRWQYQSNRSEEGGRGWSTDYPRADQNLMIRLSEITTIRVAERPDGDMASYVVRASPESLYDCPMLYASDAGTMMLRDEEATELREYMAKGGFIWVDDFWGDTALSQWRDMMVRFIPWDYTVETLPEDDPILWAYQGPQEILQVANLHFWKGSKGGTDERGEESPRANPLVVRNLQGHIAVLMTHNTDIADTWERENEDMDFFYAFAAEGYTIAMNVLVYAMTH